MVSGVICFRLVLLYFDILLSTLVNLIVFQKSGKHYHTEKCKIYVWYEILSETGPTETRSLIYQKASVLSAGYFPLQSLFYASQCMFIGWLHYQLVNIIFFIAYRSLKSAIHLFQHYIIPWMEAPNSDIDFASFLCDRFSQIFEIHLNWLGWTIKYQNTKAPIWNKKHQKPGVDSIGVWKKLLNWKFILGQILTFEI